MTCVAAARPGLRRNNRPGYGRCRREDMAPTQLAGLLVGVLLCACSLGAMFDLAAAGPVAAASGEAAPAQPAIGPRGRAYLFRGFAGLIFSLGMDRLAERIERAGFPATVNEAVMCSAVATEAICNYRQAPAPITVIGHSVGAACALSFAEMLSAENISVSLLVTTDPARISGDVPLNVERYINIFQSNSILGGRDVMPVKGFQGQYASFDLVEHNEINHLNIEKAEFMHEQVVTKIEQLGTTPAKTEAETVPIKLVIPADAALELWDSGMPVVARAGDTLQTLATLYGVPRWSLAQINRISGGAPLAPGRRIIVPRHLLPLATPDTGAISSQAPARH